MVKRLPGLAHGGSPFQNHDDVVVATTAGTAGIAGMAGMLLVVEAGVDELRAFSFFARTPTVTPRATMTIRNIMMTQSFAPSAIS